ncbi:ATP-binding protein [Spongiactinospora sp. TRM90649]|uniref:ATP-binding protein n=1 Tax=Spongiactinospora sp. TRM90649 TaxID=3031114 RepID=UPI0023F89AA9|nr:ATP-binding protein [Spongiactinospora sp. TRM90649]MDF5752504.1 ATP-binding protein [Spongiactinospora sp. TRM90649]
MTPDVLPQQIREMIRLCPGGMTWRRTFPGRLDQVASARVFVGFLLADSACREDAELIASELAANAVRHTGSGEPRGTFIVEVARSVGSLRIAVYDCGRGGAPVWPDRDSPGWSGHRGLAIVSVLAHRFGHRGDDERGHMVWARLPDG